MYLRKIRIQRMKRIRDLTLEMPAVGGAPRMWTVLIGENGTAKTSILQAIALAAAGKNQVNSVATRRVDQYRDRRTDDEDLDVEATFTFTPESVLQRKTVHPQLPDGELILGSMVQLAPKATSFHSWSEYRDKDDNPIPVDDDPLDQARTFNRQLWFVAVFGVSRVLPDSGRVADLSRPSVERLKPLFDFDAQLTSLGFINHFYQRDLAAGDEPGTRARRYRDVLNEVIRLGGDDLFPGMVAFHLRAALEPRKHQPKGVSRDADLVMGERFQVRMGGGVTTVAGTSLSHGFQSTFAWIADFVGHILLEADADLPTTEMEGLVLIDEIDLYLHPRWQATLIRGLRRVFPKIQFIATTHSPVVLAGLAPDEIVRLGVDPATGNVLVVSRDPLTGDLVPGGNGSAEPDPRAMSGTELYDEYFGIDRLTPNPDGEKIRTYLTLSGDPLRNDRQEQQVQALRKELALAGIHHLVQPVDREKTP